MSLESDLGELATGFVWWMAVSVNGDRPISRFQQVESSFLIQQEASRVLSAVSGAWMGHLPLRPCLAFVSPSLSSDGPTFL